jgi:hypothetical protein
MRLEPGLQRVRFVGGPLDGSERVMAKSMNKFSPSGPENGTYRPRKSDSTVWKWKEGK